MTQIAVTHETVEELQGAWPSYAAMLKEQGYAAMVTLKSAHAEALVSQRRDGSYQLVTGSRALFNRWMRGEPR